ncbi:OadG family protein [Clostridium grantii]|uniref:Oxaloacetate decarboxylase, gamma chain n=1 Tax=Clostridium grantii DSM 8605 TaxID=1121316 RepID=A0A1M5T7R0_9CLOT|nr:OadG family protein [Clostridium grantii]SHH46640.1 Oxaloacetate decarboxylase, gamma chain [Clostridium grantii DSM 8605]
MKEYITIIEALKITAICMGIVFVTLYVISLIIGLFKIIFSEKKEKSQVTEIEKVKGKEEKIIGKAVTDEEVIVAITAAINMSNEKKNSKFRIVSMREVGE